MDLATLLHGLLIYVMFPLWLAAGAGDWWCHRRTHIEATSGPRESQQHLSLYLLIAMPLIAALFLRINALLLAGMLLAVLAHTLGSLWDTTYTQPRRHIAPIEQQIHGYLEVLPLVALAIVVILHWPAMQQPEWTLAPRDRELPRAAVVIVLVALTAGLTLILEELSRGLRARSTDRHSAG
jgi:hypothetical protein